MPHKKIIYCFFGRCFIAVKWKSSIDQQPLLCWFTMSFGFKTASPLNKNVKIGTLPMGLDFCWVLCIHIHTQLQMLCITTIQKKSEMTWSTSQSQSTNPFKKWYIDSMYLSTEANMNCVEFLKHYKFIVLNFFHRSYL